MNEEYNNNTNQMNQEGAEASANSMNQNMEETAHVSMEQNSTGTQQSNIEHPVNQEYVSYQEGVHVQPTEMPNQNSNQTFYQQAYTPASYAAAGNSYAQINKPKKERNKVKKDTFGRRAMRVVASALCFGLVAGAVMTGMQYGAGKLWGNNNNTVTSTPTLTTADSTNKDTVAAGTGSSTVSQVVTNVMPSIVSITSTVQTSSENWFFGGQTEDSTSCGSGIIISKSDSKLLVVTNNHVIEGASAIKVGFNDEETVAATVKGTDSSSDLAVLSVKLSDMKQDTLEGIKIAVLGDSTKLTVGQDVIAIGNALGYGQSVTTGVVSALDREVTTTDYTMKLLQTDAAINPGNSGGALLNTSGEVIGINSVKYASSEVEGMGYAIPISTASPIINELMNEEVIPEAEQAYLGISGSDISSQLAEMYSMPMGVWVSEVAGSSPAEAGGLQQRDIITEFDGKTISNMEALQQYLAKHRSGDKVSLKVQRQSGNGEYEEVTLEVTLGSKSDNIR